MSHTFALIIIGFLGLNLAVYVHELGHFFVAKACNIDVEVFSLGIGPPILKFNKKNYELRISLIPFGGYCRLKGADDLRRSYERKLDHFDQIEDGSLYAVKPIKRIVTYLAGPIFNIILAYIVLTICFMLPYYKVFHKPIIALVSDYPNVYTSTNFNAKDCGLRTGDKILSINNKTVDSWYSVQKMLKKSKGDIIIKIKRNNEELNFLLKKDSKTGYGISVAIPPILSRVMPNSNLGQTGLTSKDRIISIDGKPTDYALDVLEALNKGRFHTINVNRNGIKICYQYMKEPALTNIISQISFDSPLKLDNGNNMYTALGQAQTFLNSLAKEAKSMLRKVLMGEMATKQVLSGPLQASYVIGDITVNGFSYDLLQGIRSFLYALGIISISLAIGNLLPIPAFDGGSILVCIIEIIKGKTLKPRSYITIQVVGMIIMFIIGLLVTYGDIIRFGT